MRTITTLFGTLMLTALSFGQQTNESVDVAGNTRTYVQYLPTGFNPSTESLPVVFCLHGIGDVATNIANIGFNQIADTARFIAIYPQGVPNSFSQNSWNNGTILGSNIDDLTFFNRMIDHTILDLNADPTRIYVSGFSMGAIMSYHLACNLNPRVAAIASMSGAMSSNDLTNCAPTYATPVIHFHGTADGTVPYDASPLPTLALATESIEYWRTVHTCATTSDSTQLPDTAPDGYTVDRFIYQNCTPLSSLEHWRINGGDHEYFYQPNNDFTEAIEIWLFFRQWSHSNPAPAGVDELSVAQFTINQNPFEESLEISVYNTTTLYLQGLDGKSISTYWLSSGEHSIDVTDLPDGIYILSDGNTSKRIVKL